jgi:hypothetical protein
LDDYLIVGRTIPFDCHMHLNNMLAVCEHLGFPIATDKLEGPVTCTTFLSILIDADQQELRLPADDKLQALNLELAQWRTTRKTTKRNLMSLIGKLSFAARVVPAGRLFFRRLIDLSTTATRLHEHVLSTHAYSESLNAVKRQASIREYS